ncbi:hypothetical protein PHYBOEH_010699 [Phytophthora boehmeriae]|uniref:Uncharacterized protein n=1 Tax=Phytophthora boehmeriae TaxID=109152 RepID=A0A8T1X4U2_9STRA|nr:hypothetical protein PHYBOEH_010699 [Phytophthora boehmeriae]
MMETGYVAIVAAATRSKESLVLRCFRRLDLDHQRLHGGAIPNFIYKNDNRDDDTGDLYVNYLQPLITNGAFIYTPLLGWIIDKCGSRVTFVVTYLATHIVIVLLLMPSLTAQTFMLIIFAFEQSAFYTLQFAYILLTFPADVYGSVQAFLTSCTFLMGLLNYAFRPRVQNGLGSDYLVILSSWRHQSLSCISAWGQDAAEARRQ